MASGVSWKTIREEIEKMGIKDDTILYQLEVIPDNDIRKSYEIYIRGFDEKGEDTCFADHGLRDEGLYGKE